MDISLLVIVTAFGIGLSRQLVLKPCANRLERYESGALGAMFVSLTALTLLPWYWPHLLPQDGFNPLWFGLAAVGIIKGVVWWWQFQAAQAVQKVSASSAGMFIVLGFVLVGMVNSLIGETLSWNQWLSIIGIVIVTAAYCHWGHARVLSTKDWWQVFRMVGLLLVTAMADYIVLSNTHWYFYMVFIAIGISSCVLTKGLPKTSWRKLTHDRYIWLAVLVLGVTEVLLMHILVTQIPVAIFGVVSRAAVPVFMLIAALYWHEGDWKRQLLFGVLGWLCLLPLL